MSRCKHNKGFTLIEMLVVIAIVAILVAVIIPVVGESTTKAKAAADAANLRSVLGSLNSEIMLDNDSAEAHIAAMEPVKSKTFPNAKLYVVYSVPGLIDVYYYDNGNYYSKDYLGDIAADGTTDREPKAASHGADAVWYEVGVGKVTN